MMLEMMTRFVGKGLTAFVSNVVKPGAIPQATPQAGNIGPPLHPDVTEVALPRPGGQGGGALQDDPLFRDLCDADYYALGVRDGTRCPDYETLEQGTARTVARGRLVFDHMVQTRIAWLDDAELKQLAVGQQGSALGCERLRVQSNAWRRDIETLKQQRELAGEGQGWIEPLLVDYRTGYQRALRESTDTTWLR